MLEAENPLLCDVRRGQIFFLVRMHKTEPLGRRRDAKPESQTLDKPTLGEMVTVH